MQALRTIPKAHLELGVAYLLASSPTCSSKAIYRMPGATSGHSGGVFVLLLRGPFGKTSGISSFSAIGAKSTETSSFSALAKRSILSIVQFLISRSTSLTNVLLNPAIAASCSCERFWETRYARRFRAKRVRKGFVLLVLDIYSASSTVEYTSTMQDVTLFAIPLFSITLFT